tara:strand:+ start:396 stop:572 length:177 start_codon:yes stop_codon:yes gene_type:complete
MVRERERLYKRDSWCERENGYIRETVGERENSYERDGREQLYHERWRERSSKKESLEM